MENLYPWCSSASILWPPSVGLQHLYAVCTVLILF